MVLMVLILDKGKITTLDHLLLRRFVLGINKIY